eukprot:Plantae.Rhodophyta-Hildenbrandia_rubra.ctg8617.p2 GENE.Plantae.Rhodophyta-Hildenbrandia_rubra.ctg8617~~Plantae.Rhodophyta-Hildenbrandia_rubra.ctg8617.p2  ORF type:complete len:625 (-),score=123.52 Plantae.Rhodophyta-Hildenbrandia_rubra.ctg8617:395-2269(-)
MNIPLEDESDEEEYIPLKRRRVLAARSAAATAAECGAASLHRAAQLVARQTPLKASNDSHDQDAFEDEKLDDGKEKKRTLLDEVAELKARFTEEKTVAERLEEEEKQVLKQLDNQPALKTVGELAKNVKYTEPLKTSWRPPRWLEEAGEKHHRDVRELHKILVEGEKVPPPCVTFKEMKLPKILYEHLKRKGIKKPTPIQMQGLPAALSGRDMIGIAFTGSGKTLVFSLPMISLAWEMEAKMPFTGGEGPSGVVICPSRELARQTFEVVEGFCDAIYDAYGPRLHCFLATGGVPIDVNKLRRGVHIVVATPGRLLDMLRRRRLNFDSCTYLCLDEADRLIDLGFEEDVRAILDFFKAQRQTLMFSATMPAKIQSFAASALVKPVVVNVGRAGAASLDIIQSVEFVRQDAKIVQLLETINKTPPPVMIFCENKKDVDEIQVYLLMKGILAVSIHGSKDQEERDKAMKQFKAGKKDVLVATDVAAKGIDFPNIRHVINFDMPKEIENYVHRIGRTGRSGRTGHATTYICHTDNPTVLADLKQLLIEAKQEIPSALAEIRLVDQDAMVRMDVGGVKGCAYCGGLGHRINACPKLEAERLKVATGTGGGTKDRVMADPGGTRGYGGDW